MSVPICGLAMSLNTNIEIETPSGREMSAFKMALAVLFLISLSMHFSADAHTRVSDRHKMCAASNGGAFGAAYLSGVAPRPADDLAMCLEFKHETCCTKASTAAIRRWAYPYLVPPPEGDNEITLSSDCRNKALSIACSACDPRIGTGAFAGVCEETCDSWYIACSHQFFTTESHGSQIAPCTADSLLCWPLESAVRSGADLCERSGIRVVPRDDPLHQSSSDQSQRALDKLLRSTITGAAEHNSVSGKHADQHHMAPCWDGTAPPVNRGPVVPPGVRYWLHQIWSWLTGSSPSSSASANSDPKQSAFMLLAGTALIGLLLFVVPILARKRELLQQPVSVTRGPVTSTGVRVMPQGPAVSRGAAGLSRVPEQQLNAMLARTEAFERTIKSAALLHKGLEHNDSTPSVPTDAVAGGASNERSTRDIASDASVEAKSNTVQDGSI